MSRVALLSPTSLLGKEIRQALENRSDLAGDLRLLAVDEQEVGALTEIAGAAALVNRFDPLELDGVDVLVTCGEIEKDRRALAEIPSGFPVVVASRGATLADGAPRVPGASPRLLPGARLVSPPPRVVALAHLLAPLAPLGIAEAVATLLEPASIAGEAGLDELFEQTRAILAFQTPAKSKLFPGQIAFNLLPSHEDPQSTAALLDQALGARTGATLAILQAGVFHSLTVSLRVRFAAPIGEGQVRRRLAERPTLELVRRPDRLGAVAAAGTEKILIGEVRQAADSVWIWAVLDNLTTGGSANVLRLVEELAAGPADA
jgi:aspartate-semialdehyde dehydrogenase